MSPSERRRLNPQVPLLIVTCLSAQAAAAVVTATVHESPFTLLVHGALLVALALSLGNLRWRLPLNLLVYAAIVGMLILFSSRYAVSPLAAVFFPFSSMGDPNLAMAVLLVWLLIGFSVLQYHRRNLIFVSTCGLALFGLIGVINLEPGFLVAFAIYLFATILAWSYDALLDRAPQGATGKWWRMARSQAVSSATVLASVSLAAFFLSTLLHASVPSPFAGSGRFRPVWTWAGALIQGNFLFSKYFLVGAGPANLSEQVLFRVQADYLVLWRGRGYDHYDGHTWTQTLTGDRWIRRSGPHTFHLVESLPPGAKLNRQHFWVEKASTPVVLAAAEPVEVSFPQEPAGLAASGLKQDASGSLTVAPIRLPGSSYMVVSVSPESNPEKLRAAGTSYPSWLREKYIENVPLATEAALSGLAQEITAGAETPYDQALAIMQYLEANYFYTERGPVTPQREDAATYFLLKTRRGACDLFATAMAVMLRLTGVPTRVATGFISGDYDPQTRTRLIRASDAHAWVEVYFPGYDWVPFNPSPQRELEQEPLWTLLHRGQSWYVITKIAKSVGLLALGLALVILLFMAVVDPRLLQARWRNLRARFDPWERAALECRRASVALLATAALSPSPGDTPLEMLGQAENTIPPPAGHLRSRLRRLIEDLYRLRFAPQPGSPEQARQIARQFRTLRRRLRRCPR